ncbi:MAG: hypothetical protein IPP07_00545 [Holophagales bacterium]|nr:hypothetical protein [Holophagales bacterium]
MTKKPTRPKRATRPTKPQPRPGDFGAPQDLDLVETLHGLEMCPPKHAAKAQALLLEVKEGTAAHLDELLARVRSELLSELDKELARILGCVAVGVRRSNPRAFGASVMRALHREDAPE